MCLILFSYQQTPGFSLALAANRDEFYRRPTRPMRFWPEDPQLLAGQDRREGGTWLGVTRSGRFAAVTNYREPPDTRADRLSRGRLTLDFLQSSLPPAAWIQTAQESRHRYGGFNLLVGDASGLWYLGNRGDAGPASRLTPGLYGLSNDVLDTPWFKVEEGKRALAQSAADGHPHAEMVRLLRHGQRAQDEQLPNTGVGRKLERMLSPRFIRSPLYGTRASTALTIRANGEVAVTEQNYTYFGLPLKRQEFVFTLPGSQGW